MFRHRFALRSSHLLMWSSPILLLVLVFTLNSRPLHATTTTTVTTHGTTQNDAISTTTSTTTSVGVGVRTTVSTLHSLTSTSVRTRTTIKPTAPPAMPANPKGTAVTTTSRVTTTTAPFVHSSAATETNAATISPTTREELDGALSLESPAALIPLQGPNHWTLVATHQVTSTLLCGSHSVAVQGSIRVGANQTCQLDINVATGAPTAWSLRIVP